MASKYKREPGVSDYMEALATDPDNKKPIPSWLMLNKPTSGRFYDNEARYNRRQTDPNTRIDTNPATYNDYLLRYNNTRIWKGRLPSTASDPRAPFVKEIIRKTDKMRDLNNAIIEKIQSIPLPAESGNYDPVQNIGTFAIKEAMSMPWYITRPALGDFQDYDEPHEQALAAAGIVAGSIPLRAYKAIGNAVVNPAKAIRYMKNKDRVDSFVQTKLDTKEMLDGIGARNVLPDYIENSNMSFPRDKKGPGGYVYIERSKEQNLEDLRYAQKFATEKNYGWNFDLQDMLGIAKSSKRTDAVVKGLIDRHNTYIRGINLKKAEQRGIISGLDQMSEQEINDLARKSLTTTLPEVIGGTMNLPNSVRRSGSALYTSNSDATGISYADFHDNYGFTGIVRPKKLDYTDPDRKKWFEVNSPNYANEITIGLEKSKRPSEIVSQVMTMPDRRKIGTHRDIEYMKSLASGEQVDDLNKIDITNLGNTNINYKKPKRVEDLFDRDGNLILSESEARIIVDDKVKRIMERTDPYYSFILEKYNTQFDKLPEPQKKAIRKNVAEMNRYLKLREALYSDAPYVTGASADIIKAENKRNGYAHYIHLGRKEEELFDLVSMKRITKDNTRNRTRTLHDGEPSRGRTLASILGGSIIPYGMSKKQSEDNKQ